MCRAPRLLLAVLAISTAAACAADDLGSPDVDAAAGDDAPTASGCTVAAELGDLGARDGTPMASGAAGSRIVSVSMTVATDGNTRDALFVQLKGGKGAFAAGDPVPGTYPITGADADYATCGVCVTIIGDIIAGQGPTQFYFATGGAVTITSASGRLTGSVSNLDLGELDLGTSALVPGGCTSHVGAASFDEALP